MLGSAIGGAPGAALGRNAGAWISKVVGSGDYTVSQNSLADPKAIGVPDFTRGKRSIVIKHKEYLRDVTGSTAFSLFNLAINPGSATTFPWLSAIAANFQQYRFKGLLFEFVSTSATALNSTNTALGTVIMGTNYNVTLPNFTSKAEMDQYEFSCSTRPSESLLHPIECDPDETPMTHLYVRSGALPSGQDQRLYDLGNFQFATTGMQASATIGELWVTYEVEFVKPRIQPGGSLPGQFTKVSNGPYVDASAPLGSIQTTPIGDLGVTIISTGAAFDTIYFPPSITSGRFFIGVYWAGSVAAATSFGADTFTNLTTSTGFFRLGTATSFQAPTNAVATSTFASKCQVVTVDGYSASGSSIQINLANTYPDTPVSVDIVVICIPSSDDYV